MKSLTRAMLTLSAILALTSPTVAQERPDCTEGAPGACFIDEGSSIFYADRDNDGDLLIVHVPLQSDEFIRFAPNGSVFAHAQSIETDLQVIPSTGGTLTGLGHFSINSTLTPTDTGGYVRCPATYNLSGTVSNTDGTRYYEVTGTLVTRRARDGSCVEVLHDIRIVAE